MKTLITIMLLLLLSVTPSFATGRLVTGDEADTLLSQIKQNQAQINTITGSFTEERLIATMPAPLVFTGKVYARPPSFLFLAYEKPLAHIMKVTGDTVLFYVEGAKTADKVDLHKMGEGGAPPNLFAWNPSDFKGEIIETETGYLLSNPQIKAGDREIRISLNKHSLLVQSLILQEPGGDKTTIHMDTLQINKEIPKEIEAYTLPVGVTINMMGQ